MVRAAFGRGKSYWSAGCFAVALVSACQTVDHTRLQPAEPQSLIGEWTGDFHSPDNVGRNVFTLIITRVDGERVSATLEVWGGPGRGRFHHERNIQGTLRGNDLTIGPYYTFRVDGGRMTGVGRHGADVVAIELVKRTGAVPHQASGIPAAPGAAGSIDGVYAGDVCLGPSPNGDPARCFRAKATVRDGKIVGGWPGREGVTVKLTGEVSTMGDVKIEWHSERPDGSQFSRADLSGTIQNGHLDASGAFSSGRTLSINWTLGVPGSDSPRKGVGRQ
jgi:hypothetical protein